MEDGRVLNIQPHSLQLISFSMHFYASLSVCNLFNVISRNSKRVRRSTVDLQLDLHMWAGKVMEETS